MTMFILLCLIAVCMCVATAGAVRVDCDRTITVPMGFGLMSCAVSVLAVGASIDWVTLGAAVLVILVPLIVGARAIAH